MIDKPMYGLAIGTLPSGEDRYAIVDRDGELHDAACRWIEWMSVAGKTYGGHSPNTVKAYASRVAWFLSWISLTKDWREVTVHDLAMWRNVVTATPAIKTNGRAIQRKPGSISPYLTAVKSFYEWADREPDLLRSDVVARMTQIKYFAPGTPAGGEHGRQRRVLIDELNVPGAADQKPPPWIEDAAVRAGLEQVELNPRDRFLIDLLNCTGIRVGEALSLFNEDMHLGGGSPELGCRIVDPHFHVRLTNQTENGANAKGGPRALFPHHSLIDSYLAYLIERDRRLSAAESEMSRHVFVSLYDPGYRGRAMRYAGVQRLMKRLSRMLNYDLTGPHVLRHSLATRLINGIDCEPVDIRTVQNILGHASLASTQVYTNSRELHQTGEPNASFRRLAG